MKLAVQELVVHAPIEQLFELLVDPELFVLWMADDATLDPVPGGVVRWTHPNGDSCSGTYVEVVPAEPGRVHLRVGARRGPDPARAPRPSRSTSPPGPTGPPTSASCTAASSDAAADAHQGGWGHYLDRLRRTAEGEQVGPDPWADRRVPTPEELAR